VKITKEDKDYLYKRLDETIENIGLDKILDHKNLMLGKDHNMRFRWDLFHLAEIRIGDGIGVHGELDLYSYMNDNHIDTVLKRYVKDRGL